MHDANLQDLRVFVAVAQTGGFRAAATALGMAPGSVSETLRRIEQQLGVRLIERTTRSMALTQAGERLYQQSLPAISMLQQALGDVREQEDVVSGTLRLTAPRSSGAFFLDELIAQFSLQHPEVQVEVLYNDQKVDLVQSGVDAAIRSQTLLEKDTHATAIGPELNMALVAAPAYIRSRGEPHSPEAVTQHDGICFAFDLAFDRARQLAPWRFLDQQQQGVLVTPKPRIVVNDLLSLLHYAQAGLGLAYVYRKPAQPLIDSGKLLDLLPNQVPNLPQYSINYLSKRHMPQRLRAFIDFAKASVGHPR